MASNLITYTYGASPYGYKIHSIIRLSGIETYRNVEVSRVLPRPELAAIGVAYRRIPVVAFGRDVYADSQAIIDRLAQASSAPALHRNPAAAYAYKLLGDAVFRTALVCIPPAALTPEFVDDRRSCFPILGDPKVLSGALRSHGLGELRSLFAQIQAAALGGGQQYFEGASAPTLLDAHVAWSVRWVLTQIGVGAEPGFGKQDLPQLWAWLERFIAATASAPQEITGDVAAKEILSSQAQPLPASIGPDPSGLALGERVAVNQTDAEPTHPTEGTLVGLSVHEVVVEVASGVRVHLPRLGQRIEKA